MRRKRRASARYWAIGFAGPAALLIGIFVLYPLADTAGVSLTDFNGLQPGEFVGLANYRAIFADPEFLLSLWNTFLITAVTCVVLTCLPLPVAYWIHRHMPFRRFFRAALYIPVVLPIIVSAVAWKWVLDQNGLLNYVLQALGVVQQPVGWLSDPDVALWSVVFVVIWRSFGIYLLIYLANLFTIPEELFEASSLDGAGGIRTFFSVVVPMMKPSVVLCTVVSFAGSVKVFDEIYILTGGGPMSSTKNTAFLIWEAAFQNLAFGPASAMAMVLLATVAVFIAGIYLVARPRKS